MGVLWERTPAVELVLPLGQGAESTDELLLPVVARLVRCEHHAVGSPDERALLALPDAGLVISAREAPEFRDGLFKVGITHTSAGSHTDPGGYTEPDEATGQFEVADLRSPSEVAGRLRELGFEPVWEDWSRVLPATEAMLSRT